MEVISYILPTFNKILPDYLNFFFLLRKLFYMKKNNLYVIMDKDETKFCHGSTIFVSVALILFFS